MKSDTHPSAPKNLSINGNDERNIPSAQPVTLPVSPEILEIDEAADLEIEVEPEDIVEAAEQLLREGAPHDFDVIVIGGGPGGIAAALGCARGGLHTALVEAREIGGTALNRGGIGSKSLLKSVEVLRVVRSAKQFGVEINGEITPDFQAMQTRKNEIIARLRANASQKLEDSGVEIIAGQARFVESHSLEITSPLCETRRLSAIHIVVAVGGVPARIAIEGANLTGAVTSDEILEQSFVPPRLVVVGAGSIGVEMASLFVALGSQVTILEESKTVLPAEDIEIQKACRLSLEKSGITVETEAIPQKMKEDNGIHLVFRQGETEKTLHAEQVLLATGRVPNWAQLGLDAAGISEENGKIEVDDSKQTSVSGVYAIGDCIRRAGWANQAAFEGDAVAASILGIASDVEARFVPAYHLTHPEIASVGFTVDAAGELGIESRAVKFSFSDCERAAIHGESEGFVKIVFEVGTERLLGCQIIGPRAGELINEMSLAVRCGITVSALATTLHAHLSLGQALSSAAIAARHQQ